MNADLRGLVERLTEIACRDLAVSVTVRADDLRAILSRLSVAQGQGFVMVPAISTSEMDWAGYEAAGSSELTPRCFERIYAAMLAAAPAQPDGVDKGPVFSSIERDSPYCED